MPLLLVYVPVELRGSQSLCERAPAVLLSRPWCQREEISPSLCASSTVEGIGQLGFLAGEGGQMGQGTQCIRTYMQHNGCSNHKIQMQNLHKWKILKL